MRAAAAARRLDHEAAVDLEVLAGEAVVQPGAGRSRWVVGPRWGVFVLAAALAALLTPYGIAGLMQPFRLMLRTSKMSPAFGSGQNIFS